VLQRLALCCNAVLQRLALCFHRRLCAQVLALRLSPLLAAAHSTFIARLGQAEAAYVQRIDAAGGSGVGGIRNLLQAEATNVRRPAPSAQTDGIGRRGAVALMPTTPMSRRVRRNGSIAEPKDIIGDDELVSVVERYDHAQQGAVLSTAIGMFACEAQSPLAHACDGSLTPGGSARVGRKRRKGMEPS
jgi:hypothetical protein